jgi:hypothetical protein
MGAATVGAAGGEGSARVTEAESTRAPRRPTDAAREVLMSTFDAGTMQA